MKQRLKNQNGTTLVELIVCMVLLAIFTLCLLYTSDAADD